LAEEVVLPLTDAEWIRASLEQQFGAIAWEQGRHGRTEADVRSVGLTFNDDPALPGLALRCSPRAAYAAVVQALCDWFGWVAFDESPALY
jgi:hypothetical protein